MRYWLGFGCFLLAALASVEVYKVYCEKDALAEFRSLSDHSDKEVTRICNSAGGTVAKGVELTFTGTDTEITAGYYCINTKNLTDSIR